MTESLFIRNMVPSDLEEVLKVEQASFLTPWSRAAFEAEIYENELACYLVAEKDGVIIGYAGMWIIFDEAHVTNIAILPTYRGLGYGELLLKMLITSAKDQGAQSMTLEVRASNIAAKNLYNKYGFRESGIRPKYYADTQEDAIIMWLESL